MCNVGLTDSSGRAASEESIHITSSEKNTSTKNMTDISSKFTADTPVEQDRRETLSVKFKEICNEEAISREDGANDANGASLRDDIVEHRELKEMSMSKKSETDESNRNSGRNNNQSILLVPLPTLNGTDTAKTLSCGTDGIDQGELLDLSSKGKVGVENNSIEILRNDIIECEDINGLYENSPKNVQNLDISHNTVSHETDYFAEPESEADPFSNSGTSDDYQPDISNDESTDRSYDSDEKSIDNSEVSLAEPAITCRPPAKSDTLLDNKVKVADKESIENSKVSLAEPVITSREPPATSDTSLDKKAGEDVLQYRSSDNATLATISGKSRWNKQFFCVFCEQYFSKLPRHWYLAHANELEVAKIMSLDKKSQERNRLIALLQNRGAYIHNTMVIEAGKGKIVPMRRPQEKDKKDPSKYIPCQFCYKLISQDYLYRHRKKCSFKKEEQTVGKNKCIRSISMPMLPTTAEVSERFKENILSKMQGDNVFRIIRNDNLILKYGESEFRRLGHDKRYHRTIIDRIREVGRLILAVSTAHPEENQLSGIMNPKGFALIKEAVMKIAGFNEVDNAFQSPSLALKLGMTIKKCASMLKGDYLLDDVLKMRIPVVDDFLSVMNAKWSIEIASHAHRTLTERRWNAPKRMPLAKDIQKLHTFLKNRSDFLRQQLGEKCDPQIFQELSEVTLVMIIILNRRKVGEVQYIDFREYQKAKSVDPDADVFQSLSLGERELSKSLVRLIIRGKKGRGVPVLLTEYLRQNVDLLTDKRHECGIHQKNNFLFASLKHAAGHFEAHRLLKKYAEKAQCEAPGILTSTKLRKHVATMVQLLNLKEHELDSLAQFMGHDIRVHREYYRLADETVQLAKISKVLIHMERGNIHLLKGKSLDEIEVEDILDKDDESSTDSLNTACGISNDVTDSTIPKKDCNVNINENLEKSNKPKKLHVPVEDDLGLGIKQAAVPNNPINTLSIKKKVQKKPWSENERKVTLSYSKNHIVMKTTPGKKEIDEFLSRKGAIITDRSWRNIKDCVYNEIRRLQKERN